MAEAVEGRLGLGEDLVVGEAVDRVAGGDDGGVPIGVGPLVDERLVLERAVHLQDGEPRPVDEVDPAEPLAHAEQVALTLEHHADLVRQ